VTKTIDDLGLQMPQVTDAQRRLLATARRRLSSEP
jgi:hypothetical protein